MLATVLVAGLTALFASAASAATVAPPKPAGGPRTATPLTPPTSSAAPKAASAVRTTSTTNAIATCGTEITTPGTYHVTADLVDTGGYCIWIAADNVNLTLNGHKITGDGTDECILVEDPSYSRSVKSDTINGGSTSAPGQLNGCGYGIYAYATTRTAASNLTINNPDPNSNSNNANPYSDLAGVFDEYSVSSSYTNVTVNITNTDKYTVGMLLYYGSGNQIIGSATTAAGNQTLFDVYYEYGDALRNDKATGTGSNSSGVGFADYYDNRDT